MAQNAAPVLEDRFVQTALIAIPAVAAPISSAGLGWTIARQAPSPAALASTVIFTTSVRTHDM